MVNIMVITLLSLSFCHDTIYDYTCVHQFYLNLTLSNKYSSMLRPGLLIHTALPLSVYAYLSFLMAKRSTFPSTSLLISCYFSSYFTFIPSHIHSLFTLPQFIYSLIRISIFFKFSFKTLKQTQFICIHVTTMRMT